jgi:hypothetical protein
MRGNSQLAPVQPVLQVNPQLVPSHVAVAFAGAVHGVQLAEPHVCTLVFSAQLDPHTW